MLTWMTATCSCSSALYLSTEFFMQPVPDHLKTVTCFSTSYFLKQTKSSSHCSHRISINLVTCIRKEPNCNLGHVNGHPENVFRRLTSYSADKCRNKNFQPLKRIYGCGLYRFIIHNFTTFIRYYKLLQPKGQRKNETRLQPVYGQTRCK
jgi:hypothetical protein